MDGSAEAAAAFAPLDPFWACLRQMQSWYKPFGRDYLALDIAKQSLESAAYHFTRHASFCGAKATPPVPWVCRNDWRAIPPDIRGWFVCGGCGVAVGT